MVGFNTCENWEKGLFFLRETLERNDSEATVANDMPVVLYEEMDQEEFEVNPCDSKRKRFQFEGGTRAQSQRIFF